MSDIIESIQSVGRSVGDVECDVTFKALSGAVSMMLEQVILADESECELLCEWEEKIRESACHVIGGHKWIPDHCGYWGHDLCSRCQTSKYPELAGQRCHAIGKMTEDEYLKQQEGGDER